MPAISPSATEVRPDVHTGTAAARPRDPAANGGYPMSPRRRWWIAGVAAVLLAGGTALVIAVVWRTDERADRFRGQSPGSGSEEGANSRPQSISSAGDPAGAPVANRENGETYLDHAFRSAIQARPALQLSGAQVDHLVADFLEFEEVLSDVQGRFVQELEAGPGAIKVHVPPFPVEGKGVRDLLYQRLQADFPGQFERIRDELGPFVDETFRAFGVAEQTITVRQTPNPNVFEVEWEASNPDGRSAGDEPGETPYSGGSRLLSLTRDQLNAGEYRFLGAAVERRFPSPPPPP